jgi:transcriptional regulator with XRE-family HTH domain
MKPSPHLRKPKEAFALALHELRVRHGLSIAELAARCHVKPIHIEMIERELQEPGLVNLVTLAEAVGLRFSDLALRMEQHFYAPLSNSQ